MMNSLQLPIDRDLRTWAQTAGGRAPQLPKVPKVSRNTRRIDPRYASTAKCSGKAQAVSEAVFQQESAKAVSSAGVDCGSFRADGRDGIGKIRFAGAQGARLVPLPLVQMAALLVE